MGCVARQALDARRVASSALIVCGALLLIGSATSVARGAIARDAARARWAEMEAERSVVGAKLSTGEARWSEARGTPVARVIIPRLGLDEVVVEGVGDDELRAGPGHMIGSVLPGDRGTSVISAHRDRHFHALGGITVGDTVVTESASGTVVWTVSRIRVVGADDSALDARPTPTLMLTTCWPIRYVGPARERLIVEAEIAGKREEGSGKR